MLLGDGWSPLGLGADAPVGEEGAPAGGVRMVKRGGPPG